MTFNKNTRNAIAQYCDTPLLLDQLVVSAFLRNNRIEKYSDFIASFVIDENLESRLFKDLATVEDIINIFELAIPNADVVSNGAIYTPPWVRELIVNESVKKSTKPLDQCICADITCGCGAFLLTIASTLRNNNPNLSYREIFRRLWGVDISLESIRRTKIVLSMQAALNGEVIGEEDFHLIAGNALSPSINAQIKSFDIIVGNPPYVRSKHINSEDKALLNHWSVSRCGNADLYIPFFEIAVSHLNKDGIVGFITPNSYFKSVNARKLRQYLTERHLAPSILNFGEERIFKNKMVYTCVTLIQNTYSEIIHYVKMSVSDVKRHLEPNYTQVAISSLDYHKGWNLNAKDIMENINRIESAGVQLGQLCNIKNGIATLANDVFIFKPEGEEDDVYLYHGFKIEKDVCRDIVKPNTLKHEAELESKREKIIFPYDKTFNPFKESFFRKQYPNAYSYLLFHKKTLLRRDKGECDYPWYAFGRTQAIADSGKKLLFPYMADSPHFIYTSEEKMLIYCGYAIYDDSEEELQILKRILESSIFEYYIRHTSKPYSAGYYSYAKNYVKGFGVCHLTSKEKKYLLSLCDEAEVSSFLKKKYNLSL